MKYDLQFKDVVKRYGRFRALDGLSLQVPRGAVFGLVGSNGAGKTTALAAAAGLLRVQAGTIGVLGDGPFDSRSRPGVLSLLPQDALFPGHARVRELLSFYGALQGLAPMQLPLLVAEALERVNLADRADAKTRTLSHGMRRRLAIAQAFLGTPQLVLLDEPLNGLDPREVANFRDLIRMQKGNVTIVISSHLLTEIEAVCDHVGIIENGRAVRQDPLHELVGTYESVSYTLGTGDVPIRSIEKCLLNARAEWDAARRVLTVQFGARSYTTAQVNAGVIPVLLASEIEILEIRRGSDLEQAYLDAPKPDAK